MIFFMVLHPLLIHSTWVILLASIKFENQNKYKIQIVEEACQHSMTKIKQKS